MLSIVPLQIHGATLFKCNMKHKSTNRNESHECWSPTACKRSWLACDSDRVQAPSWMICMLDRILHTATLHSTPSHATTIHAATYPLPSYPSRTGWQCRPAWLVSTSPPKQTPTAMVTTRRATTSLLFRQKSHNKLPHICLRPIFPTRRILRTLAPQQSLPISSASPLPAKLSTSTRTTGPTTFSTNTAP